jgi:hypothetical protein
MESSPHPFFARAPRRMKSLGMQTALALSTKTLQSTQSGETDSAENRFNEPEKRSLNQLVVIFAG